MEDIDNRHAFKADANLAARKKRVQHIANLLDAKFKLPGVGCRFGWDGIVGLLPGGDILTMIPGLYLLLEARRSGVRKRKIGRMVFNLLLDALVGLIPLVGDVFDFVFKAHQRNAQILLAEMERKECEADDGVIDV